MKIVFMGTPEFSVPVLDALVAAGHEIVSVYCQPPRPAGRGKKERPTPVHARANALGLSVRHPVNFKQASDIEAFHDLQADIAVVVAYGLLLPPAILKAPKHGCLNIHASLLPRWRGAAPIHRAIMEGDTQTGTCIMQMDAGLDTGEVLARRERPIEAIDTTASLHDKLSAQGADLIVEVLSNLPNLVPEPQPEQGVTYAKKIDKAEAEIDWSEPAERVDHKIRGLSPFPGAWSVHNGERIKVLLSCHVPDQSGPIGRVLSNDLVVGCGKDSVRLLKLQRAGKSAQETEEFLRGYPISKDDIFNG